MYRFDRCFRGGFIFSYVVVVMAFLLCLSAIVPEVLAAPLVNITVSAAHKPSEKYLTPFNTPGNFTINYSKVPKIFRGVTPIIPRYIDLELDTVRQFTPVRLDPRTCPNDLAYCYKVLEHTQNRTTFGKNYTPVSSYLLPSVRIKQYVCIGNDTACVRSSTNCFCPEKIINPPPTIEPDSGRCSSESHLCMNSYGSFVKCDGNLTLCKQRYDVCGCGMFTACVAQMNTCVNTRNELVKCKGTMPACLQNYRTCYCGPDMMFFQSGCTSWSHTCTRGNKTSVCYGAFASCALNFDKCDC